MGIKKENYNPKGGLLLIEQSKYRNQHTYDATSAYIKYFNDQKEFVKRLSYNSKKNLTIRLHGEHKNLNWSDIERWSEFDSTLKVENGEKDIKSLISENRLAIHSYDSTGLTETLSKNIPCLAFWQNKMCHVIKSALPYYQSLVDAGVIHLTPKSAADKVNEIWNDVDNWWNQADVQEARKQFCDRYAKTNNNPITALKRILLS